MDEKHATRWYQVSLRRFLLAATLICMAGGELLLKPHNETLAAILVFGAIGAWFGHPIWGALAGLAIVALATILLYLALATGLVPFRFPDYL